MTNQFVIADTHFYHRNIIDLTSRPFASLSEMHAVLIRNWNDTVGVNDKVFILGDFSFGNLENTSTLLKQLNGHKILVLGNHDRAHSITWWLTAGFGKVIPYPIFVDGKYLMSHEPINMGDCGFINIHGHVHNKIPHPCGPRNLNVSVEMTNYSPVDLSEVGLLVKSQVFVKTSCQESIHEMW